VLNAKEQALVPEIQPWYEYLLLLHKDAPLTAPEVAEKLGCSVNYVYNEKHRTLRKIRDMMEGDDHDQ
jgi:DNA-directed RNA polymerase specialized sigma24 family protein